MKKELKVAVGVVIYNQKKEYSFDYVKSINSQIFKEFHVLIVDDNTDIVTKKIVKENLIPEVIMEKANCKSAEENRIQLITFAKKRNYDLLILTDFDDTYSDDRVESVWQSFSNSYSFYYNKIRHPKEGFLEQLPEITEDISQIEQFNYVGMGNSSINLNNIDENFLKTLELIKPFDWYLYSLLLIKGHKGKLIKEGFINYRVHENSLSYIEEEQDVRRDREFLIKKEFYHQMSKYDERYKNLLKKLLQVENADKSLVCNSEERYWWNLIELEGTNEN